jgi:P-type E1-E2 ATPase
MLLSYASRELSKHNVLVKNLHGMDTLGAITLLASDKTGTLTMNVMVSKQATQSSIRLVILLTMLIVAAVL